MSKSHSPQRRRGYAEFAQRKSKPLRTFFVLCACGGQATLQITLVSQLYFFSATENFKSQAFKTIYSLTATRINKLVGITLSVGSSDGFNNQPRA
jgi:hypothetical protein